MLTEDQIVRLTALGIRVLFALAIFVGGWVASKWGHALTLKGLRRAKLDEALARFFAAGCQYAIIAFAVIAALDKLGVETTSLAALIAAAGLAVGLALQGTLGNFASGVLLLFFRPFTLGDKITAAGHTGKVLDIGLFATTLGTPANERIILPNGTVTSSAIVNHTTAGEIRGTVTVGVAYGADVARVTEVLLEATLAVDLVKREPAPAVAFTDMAASSLAFAVHCWCEADDFLAMLHSVRRSIYEHLDDAGIEIPFDQIVVHRA